MTQFISVRAMPSADSRLIAAVCAAHLMSHYYLLMLAPLLAFVRADFQVHFLIVRRGDRDLCFHHDIWTVAPAGE
jgi:hypothetical protein